MTRGHFISFEGGEGCGKTTQGHMLKHALESHGISVLRTREPGGTVIGEIIRQWLLAPNEQGLASATELLLFAAARAELVATSIRPALERGEWVITDRFLDSTIVYQAMVRGLERKIVDAINSFAVQDCVPDLTFVLDVPIDIGLKRAESRQEFWNLDVANGTKDAVTQLEFWELGGDRFERESPAFHEAVRRGYHALTKAEPKRVRLINATGDIGDVHAACWAAVSNLVPAP